LHHALQIRQGKDKKGHDEELHNDSGQKEGLLPVPSMACAMILGTSKAKPLPAIVKTTSATMSNR